ncbi:MAG: dolichyl-phosphate beta-glucosyltransferase [Deltaproteobacteria bacterium]
MKPTLSPNSPEPKPPYLSVVIPAYNEEARIPLTLRSVGAYLTRRNFAYEIIVVDDGSGDGTARVVSRLTAEIPHLRLIKNDLNRGKGWVVRQGMLAATGEIRLFMDADNSTSIDQFERMIPHIAAGAAVVIGSRRVSGAEIAVPQPWLRENVGRFFNFTVRLLHGIDMEDTQAGFKAFTAQATERIFPLQTIRRWVFDVELLVIAKQFGLTVKESAIVWRNDERSHVKFSSTIKTFLELFKIKLNLWLGIYE